MVVFADEVTYGGNRKVAGKLKAMVTEKFIVSERKGIDAVQYHNCAHLLIASNESWFIPAGPQSRRWLVLDVNPAKANDRDYFNAMHYQMEEEGGLAAMLHELKERKITHDLKKAPETEALYDQRGQYAEVDSAIAFIAVQLSTGNMMAPSIDASDSVAGEPWPKEVSKADLLNSYVNWCNQNRRKTVSTDRFFKTLNRLGFTQVRFRRASRRIYGYKIPPYEQCLADAKREFGINVNKEAEDAD